jgi:hypothetical protein
LGDAQFDGKIIDGARGYVDVADGEDFEAGLGDRYGVVAKRKVGKGEFTRPVIPPRKVWARADSENSRHNSVPVKNSFTITLQGGDPISGEDFDGDR